MIKYILRKFGYILLTEEDYENIFSDLVFKREANKNERRERLVQEVTRQLLIRHYPFNLNPDCYSTCRKFAEHLADMEAIDLT